MLGNPALASLEGLGELEHVYGQICIRGNAVKLKSYKGLNSDVRVGGARRRRVAGRLEHVSLVRKLGRMRLGDAEAPSHDDDSDEYERIPTDADFDPLRVLWNGHIGQSFRHKIEESLYLAFLLPSFALALSSSSATFRLAMRRLAGSVHWTYLVAAVALFIAAMPKKSSDARWPLFGTVFMLFVLFMLWAAFLALRMKAGIESNLSEPLLSEELDLKPLFGLDADQKAQLRELRLKEKDELLDIAKSTFRQVNKRALANWVSLIVPAIQAIAALLVCLHPDIPWPDGVGLARSNAQHALFRIGQGYDVMIVLFLVAIGLQVALRAAQLFTNSVQLVSTVMSLTSAQIVNGLVAALACTPSTGLNNSSGGRGNGRTQLIDPEDARKDIWLHNMDRTRICWEGGHAFIAVVAVIMLCFTLGFQVSWTGSAAAWSGDDLQAPTWLLTSTAIVTIVVNVATQFFYLNFKAYCVIAFVGFTIISILMGVALFRSMCSAGPDGRKYRGMRFRSTGYTLYLFVWRLVPFSGSLAALVTVLVDNYRNWAGWWILLVGSVVFSLSATLIAWRCFARHIFSSSSPPCIDIAGGVSSYSTSRSGSFDMSRSAEASASTSASASSEAVSSAGTSASASATSASASAGVSSA